MNPEIKKRIEMIRRVEVPPGYKKTKIGIIPEEWDIKKFKEIATFFSGGTPPTSDSSFYDGEIPWITSGDLNKGIIYNVKGKISKQGLENSSAKMINEDTLLIALYGATSGVTAISKIHAAINQAVLAIIPKNDNSYFLQYKLESLKKWIINVYTQGGQPNLSGDIIKSIDMILPSIIEQSKIVEILSTWDKTIEKQEKLIELKKEQKNGLAFKLLTGKARINSFKSKWQKRLMSDCFERINEKNHENNNNILTISAQRGLISQEHYFSKQIASENLLRYYLLKKGDYAYNKSYSIGYPFGAIKRLENFEKGIVSPLYICFRIKNKNFSNDYFKQYFDSGFLNEEIQKIAQEGARNHGLLNVSVEEFFQIVLRIPEDIKEQKAIAEILMTADKEIELLEKELDMIKEQKKGLMELLLTGIVRVK